MDDTTPPQPAASPTPASPTVPVAEVYKDEDLVYVDPELRVVVARVEWSKTGNPKPLAIPNKTEESDEEDEKGARRKPRRQRYYPWGTYRSMKKIYKLEGKVKNAENQKTLDEVMEKALKEPFWD